jgi:hypothetical protein
VVRGSSLTFNQVLPGAESVGDAFTRGPGLQAGPGQPALTGTSGAFINSFDGERGNLATGTFTTPPFAIRGEVITLQVAGGFAPEGEYVELLVGGRRRVHATGCNSGIAGARLWVTEPFRGQLAQLRIVDRERDAWGQHRRGRAGAVASRCSSGVGRRDGTGTLAGRSLRLLDWEAIRPARRRAAAVHART